MLAVYTLPSLRCHCIVLLYKIRCILYLHLPNWLRTLSLARTTTLPNIVIILTYTSGLLKLDQRGTALPMCSIQDIHRTIRILAAHRRVIMGTLNKVDLLLQRYNIIPIPKYRQARLEARVKESRIMKNLLCCSIKLYSKLSLISLRPTSTRCTFNLPVRNLDSKYDRIR